MEKLKNLKVEEIMTSPVHTLASDWSLREAAQELLSRGYSGAPVLDEKGGVIGVLTLQDIARYAEWHLDVEAGAEELGAEKDLRRELDRKERGLGSSMHIDRLEDVTVRQVMTPAVSTISEGTPLAEATSRILGGSIHRLFVVNKRGKLVGLVSTVDVVRALHKQITR